MIIVGSQRKGSPLNPPLGATIVRIDRASVLGNPFDMGNDETLRIPVVQGHEGWLDAVLRYGVGTDPVKLAVKMADQLGLQIASTWKRFTSMEIVQELGRIAELDQSGEEVWIMCWCVPKDCHGNAYKVAIEDGRVDAAMRQLPRAVKPKDSLDWRQRLRPEVLGQQRFEYKGEWIKNWFSNFETFDQPLVEDGISYSSVEHYYQAMKSGDRTERARIAAMDAAQAKRAGRQVRVRSDWSAAEEMERALRHKFQPGTSWHERLMATGNQPIVEYNNWHDSNWGACVCPKCLPNRQENRLDVMLMQLRAEYTALTVARQQEHSAGSIGLAVQVGSKEEVPQSLPPLVARQLAPAQITELAPHQVCVFGTNPDGRHGKGAALTAFGEGYPKRKGTVGKWAIYGQARGLMQGHEGMSYGIVTKDLKIGKRSIPLSEIGAQIDELIQFAQSRPDLEFLITPFGTALAGYSHAEISGLWQGKDIPENVRLPQVWLETLGYKQSEQEESKGMDMNGNFSINDAIKQIAILEGKALDSLTQIVQSFIAQAGGADISNYAPGRINAWNGAKADLRKKGNFFSQADWWCEELHRMCERIMPDYHACLVTYSGDGETGKGIGLHGDQSYAQFTARSINLQIDPAATTIWFMGQQYPGMSYSQNQQTVARTREQFLNDEGVSLHQFELQHGSVIEFNCKNPHAAHPGSGRYSINLWKAANTKSAPAQQVWNELTAKYGRSGSGKLIDTGITPVLPSVMQFTTAELATMQAPLTVRLVRPKDYYQQYVLSQGNRGGNAAQSTAKPKTLADFFPEGYTQNDIRKVTRWLKEGKYHIGSGTITSHEVTRTDISLISGGQDGADQGELMAGAALGLKTGGVAPHGWLVSDGTSQDLLKSYGLIEGPPASSGSVGGTYRIRTILNAAQADATLLIGSHDPMKDKGSYLTLKLAEWYEYSEGKPYCTVDVEDLLPENIQATAQAVRQWIEDEGIRVLNVAGNRQAKVREFALDQAVSQMLQLALAEPLQEKASKQTEQEQPIGGYTSRGVVTDDAEHELVGEPSEASEAASDEMQQVQKFQLALEHLDPNLRTAHYQVLIDASQHLRRVDDDRLFRGLNTVIGRAVLRLPEHGFKQAVFKLRSLEDSPLWVAHTIAQVCQRHQDMLKQHGILVAIKVGSYQAPSPNERNQVGITLAVTARRDPTVGAALTKARDPKTGRYGIVFDGSMPAGEEYEVFNDPDAEKAKRKVKASAKATRPSGVSR